MTADLVLAKKKLRENNYTCVLIKGNEIYTQTERGVKPLLGFLKLGENFKGFSAADKIVGRAAAFLYIQLGVRAVYANVMSESAAKLLKEHNIDAFYEKSETAIINRTKSGLCPMEQAVLDIKDPNAAHERIIKKLADLQSLSKH